MPKRAVVYARVSTDDQAKHGYSLASQLEACRKYVADRGWKLAAEITDGGVSGATLDRVGLDRIMEMATAREIDAMVVYDLDRLSRKAVYQMLIEEELGKAGVAVHYVRGDYRDDDEGRLQKQIRAVIAEYERAKFLERAERGKRSKARRGLVVGGGRIAYGYRYDGNGHLTVMEDEAHVVALVFEWFVKDMAPIREIARRLSAHGFKTYRGRTYWAKSAVARILANESYAGTAYYNRLERAGPYSHRKVLRPRDQWIPIPVPPIVDRRTWEEAQKLLSRNRKLVRRRPRHQYLLGGMLTCRSCGYAYGGEFSKGRRYYRDGGRRHPSLVAEVAEEGVWSAIRAVLVNPAALWEGHRAHEAEVAEAKRRLSDRLEVLLKQTEKSEQKLKALTDVYLDPEIGMKRAEYARLRRQIETEMAGRRREVVELRKRKEATTITEEQVQAVEEFAAEVRQGIELLDFEEKRDVLHLLGVQGTVRHDGGQRVSIEVSGLFPEATVGVSSTTSGRCARRRRPPPAPS
jgi:site-specific DNA recombinase